jgi:catechol 2,3-dioxygenase-like lactoylglutathione lyase family enzyme
MPVTIVRPRLAGLLLAGALALAGCMSIEVTETAPAPLASPAADPTRIAAPADRVPIDIRRTTIIVADIERSLRLYRDALGMTVNYDAPMTVSGPAFAHGQPGRAIRLVLLNANDPWIGWIGLLQYTDPPLAPAAPPPTALNIGSHVIVTAVADADRACAAAERAPGVRMVVPVKTTEYPGRNPGDPPIRVRGCQLWDADGAYLELNQPLR